MTTSPVALLRAISEKLIPGLPDNLRVLLAGQVEEQDLVNPNNTAPAPTNVIDKVLDSDVRRVELMQEYDSQFL